MLDLRLLETFREVAARRSFSAAAHALKFTQPAVSQHVARLEQQVGSRLFNRDARGVTLTRAGDVLLRHAEALLDAARQAEAEVRAEGGVAVPEVHLGAFPTAAAGLVPMALSELVAARPDLRPRLRIVEPDAAIGELVRGRLDVGLLIDSDLKPAAARDGTEIHELCDDPMLVALPRGHHLARLPAIELAELRDEPWLLTPAGVSCGDSALVRRACGQAGFEPKVHLESADYTALLGLTASGMGVMLLPSLATLALPRDVVLRRVLGKVPARRIHAALRRDDDRPHVAATVEALRVAGRRIALQAAALPT